MKIALVTNCAARKALRPARRLSARSLRRGSAREVAREWVCRVRTADQRVAAKELYQGRAFREATIAAQTTGNSLHIVSAGVGFIRDTDLIPAYSLTATKNHPDAILGKISEKDLNAWWRSMSGIGVSKRSLADWIRSTRDTLVVLALTPNYLALVKNELEELRWNDLQRIRLVGPRTSADLSEDLKQFLMPYDGRLNGEDSPIRGTESDFPQRAVRHFISLVANGRSLGSPLKDSRLVRDALSGWRFDRGMVRTRLSDSELRKVISRVLRSCGGHWTVALRVLRDELHIACEQARFRAICLDVEGDNGQVKA